MFDRRRRQLLVDGRVQGTLLGRVVIYWLYCVLSVTLMMTCWLVLTSPPASSYELLRLLWSAAGPPLFGSMVVMPIVLLDLLRVSNRFAGPMFRLGREMRRLADGEPVQLVKVREGDFWYEFAEDFNRIVAQLQPRKLAVAEQTSEQNEQQRSRVRVS